MNKTIIKTSVIDPKDMDNKSIIHDMLHLNSIISEDISEDELQHYGVIGMKWGIRKDRSGDRTIRKSRGKALKSRRSMSDEQLKKSIERLQTEKRFKDLAMEDLHSGKLEVNKLLKQFGVVFAGALAGVVVSTGVKLLLKKYGISLKDD